MILEDNSACFDTHIDLFLKRKNCSQMGLFVLFSTWKYKICNSKAKIDINIHIWYFGLRMHLPIQKFMNDLQFLKSLLPTVQCTLQSLKGTSCCLFHHTDLSWSALTFCIVISFTEMTGTFKRYVSIQNPHDQTVLTILVSAFCACLERSYQCTQKRFARSFWH
jgi:hypothetical protein